MASRQKNDSTTTEAPAEATATETPVEATATPEAEKPAEKPIDLTAFKAAVAEAVAEADTSTGEVSVEHLAAVTKAYRALDGAKAKNAAKALVNDGMKEAMGSDNLAGARANLNISEKALTAGSSGGGGTKRESVPVDPTENFVQRVATLNLAYNQCVSAVPEGVSEDWQTRANELASASAGEVASYVAWLDGNAETRGDEPEVSAVIRNAAKLAKGKSGRAGTGRTPGAVSVYDGPRRSIEAHILNAFAEFDEGKFLSIADIRNTKSEEYGDELPSAGAVSARLFPKSGNSTMVKVGIRPDTQDGKKGAVKTAVPAAE